MDNKQLLKISLCFLCENACDLLQIFFPFNWQKVSTEESDYWRVKYNFKSINLVIFHWLKKFMKAKFCFVCVFYSKIVEGMMIVKYWSASKIALSLRVQYVRDKGRIRLLLLYLELDTSHCYWKSTQGLIQKKSRHQWWETYPN